MMRQYIGAARTVPSTPVAPLSNCTSAAPASRGSGGAFCTNTRASTLAMGPTRLTKASMTCRPAPVMPPPGDSRGSSRQPPLTRVECSLVKLPSMCSTSPMVPCATTRLSSRIEEKQRLLLPSANGTPAFWIAATARSASPRVSASGFSHQTGLPAAATAEIWATCNECGVARNTACTRGSATACSNSVDSSKPLAAAKSHTSSGSLLTPRMKRRRLLLPCTDSTMFLPQRPRPMTAASIMVGGYGRARKYMS